MHWLMLIVFCIIAQLVIFRGLSLPCYFGGHFPLTWIYSCFLFCIRLTDSNLKRWHLRVKVVMTINTFTRAILMYSIKIQIGLWKWIWQSLNGWTPWNRWGHVIGAGAYIHTHTHTHTLTQTERIMQALLDVGQRELLLLIIQFNIIDVV